VEFAQVLAAALHWAEASDGAFDPTMGPVTAAWGFGPDAPARGGNWRPPTRAVLDAAVGCTGWRRIEFDPSTCELRQPGELTLDFSGIAKGFAVDHACGALTALGLRDLILEIGGEVRALGHRPGAGAWNLRIALPADLEASLRLPPLPLHDLAAASSGDGWHWHEHDGRRWSHTIDPRSAAPVASGLALVTVLRESCMEADALATALTVLGPEAGLAFADAHGVAALFVERRPDGPALRRSAAWPDSAGRGQTATPITPITPIDPLRPTTPARPVRAE
ncbi:MAG: FAD:protein FMN transferase, partial [Comamonadaceae bacterium]